MFSFESIKKSGYYLRNVKNSGFELRKLKPGSNSNKNNATIKIVDSLLLDDSPSGTISSFSIAGTHQYVFNHNGRIGSKNSTKVSDGEKASAAFKVFESHLIQNNSDIEDFILHIPLFLGPLSVKEGVVEIGNADTNLNLHVRGKTGPRFSVSPHAVGIGTDTPAHDFEVHSLKLDPDATKIRDVNLYRDGANSGTGSGEAWQSFTAGSTAYLAQVIVFVGMGAWEGLLQIYDGEIPSDEDSVSDLKLLHSQPYSIVAEAANGWGLNLTKLVSITAGNKYTFLFTNISLATSSRFYGEGRSSISASTNFRFNTYFYESSYVTPQTSLAISKGNVGIGVEAPMIDLAVGHPSTGFRGGLSPLTNVSQYESDELAIYIRGSEKIRINSSGSIGIETDFPKSDLHIKKESPSLRFENINPSGGATVGKTWQLRLGTYIDNNNDRKSKLNIGQDFNILENGFVGIVTNDPKHRLEINPVGNTSTGLMVNGSVNIIGDLNFNSQKPISRKSYLRKYSDPISTVKEDTGLPVSEWLPLHVNIVGIKPFDNEVNWYFYHKVRHGNFVGQEVLITWVHRSLFDDDRTYNR